MNESFVFYKSFYEAIRKVPKEAQVELYNAICEYCFEGKEPSELNGVAEAMFILIKPNIDSSTRRYKAQVENGKKGGRPRNQNKPDENPNETQNKPNNNPTESQAKAKQNLNYNKDYDLNLNKDFLAPLKSYSEDLKGKVLEWLAYKKEIREAYKENGLINFIAIVEEKLKKYSEQQVIEAMSIAMSNRWKGIDWEKVNENNKGQRANRYVNPEQKEFQDLDRFYTT